MTRLSRYLLPTEKEAPADAEAVSHKLMVRAGLVRQLGAGHVDLPAGRAGASHRKAEQIVREEMDAIGCQEMLMPVLAARPSCGSRAAATRSTSCSSSRTAAAPTWCWP